jgi:hypothetical protein
MKLRFLGKDPESDYGGSPTLFATDRTDRKTYIVRGWEVTDPQVLAEAGENPLVRCCRRFPPISSVSSNKTTGD